MARQSDAGAPWLVMGPCIIEIDFQYQLEVNRCRKEEIIVKGNFGWVWLVMGPCIVEIDRFVIREFQGSSANSEGGDSCQDRLTTGQTAEITTISLRFSKSVGITK
ncbi:hypothetical protein DPMN_140187 [Dreissena polymorpha]|uniref:Uncharacterized protein n=1 Tax=Dreissena polymorpha TaxID=45954 RepID=A0A9D4GD28_DREPO|nr:hypothetical protein DPMN_140187 [Dreissena polymorpha]